MIEYKIRKFSMSKETIPIEYWTIYDMILLYIIHLLNILLLYLDTIG